MSLEHVDVVCISGNASTINQKLIRDGFVTRAATYPGFTNRSPDAYVFSHQVCFYLGRESVPSLDDDAVARLSRWARAHRDLTCVLLGQPPGDFQSLTEVPVLQRFTLPACREHGENTRAVIEACDERRRAEQSARRAFVSAAEAKESEMRVHLCAAVRASFEARRAREHAKSVPVRDYRDSLTVVEVEGVVADVETMLDAAMARCADEFLKRSYTDPTESTGRNMRQRLDA